MENASAVAPAQQPPPRPDHAADAAPAAASPPAHHARSASQPRGAGPPRARQPPPPPNNCVVLKNLDYNITVLDLENVVREVTGSRKAFVNVALVEDKNTRSFRGMAFVNFHTVEDAQAAMPALAALRVNNRKVFAEYRRLRPGEKERRDAAEKRTRNKYDPAGPRGRATFETAIAAQPAVDENGNEIDKRASFFAARETVKKADDRARQSEKVDREKELESDFREQLMAYRDAPVVEGEEIQDVCFDQDLSSYERRIVHVLCDELSLGHVSRSVQGGSRVLFVTKDPVRMAQWEVETADARAAAAEKAAEKAALAEEKKKKQREAYEKARAEGAVNGRSSPEVGGSRSAANSSGSGLMSAANFGSGFSSSYSGTSGPTNGGPPTKEELEGIKWFRPRSAMQAEGSGDLDVSVLRGIEKPSYKVYIPPRQPTGPDGTIGFQRRNPNPVVEAAAEDDEADSAEVADSQTSIDGLVDEQSTGKASVDADLEATTEASVGPTGGTSNTSGDSDAVTGRLRTVKLNPAVPPFEFPSGV